MQNEAKNPVIFILQKNALGKIFYLMVLGLYAHDLCKNAKNRIVISFLSQTLFETAVPRKRLKCVKLTHEQDTQVCQIRVMTEFETITLTQDGAVDLKTIAVFLFPKFNRQPFFFRDQNLMQCLRSRLPRNKFINQKNYFTISLKLI